MPASPCYQLRNVRVGNIGDQPIRPEVVDKAFEVAEAIVRPLTRQMLALFVPVAGDDILEAERRIARATRRRDLPLRILLTLGLYGLRFASIRRRRSSAKPRPSSSNSKW